MAQKIRTGQILDASEAWTTVTPTVTGFSATTTRTGRYKQVGKLVTFEYNIVGTSNATSVTVALPVTAASTSSIIFDAPALVADNGSTLTTPGRATIDPSGSTTVLGVTKDYAVGAFTASGTKIVRGVISYEAA